MDTTDRSAAAFGSVLLAGVGLVNLVAGLNYAFADGGDPVRTSANHRGGWIHLATAALVPVVIVLLLRSRRPTRTVVVAAALALSLAVGGFVAGETVVRDGSSCACEGG
jgi:hypothetical protein